MYRFPVADKSHFIDADDNKHCNTDQSSYPCVQSNGIRCNTVGVKGVKGIQGVKLLVRKVNGPMYYKSDYNRAVHEWNKLDVKYTTIMVTQSFKAVMQRYMVTSTQMTP